MNKTTIILLALTAVLFIWNSESAAQTRIRFAKGRSSAMVRGNTGNSGTEYVVRARSGQKIELTLSPLEGVGIRVTGNGRDGETVLLREERGGTFVVGLEESGDYVIFIGSVSGKPVAFSLTVAITRMSDI